MPPGARSTSRQLLGGGEAIVLTVWESLGSAILRNLPAGATEFGSEARGIAEDVVDALDARTGDAARAFAAEGAALATAARFDARTLSRRALAHGGVGGVKRHTLVTPTIPWSLF
jgi:hypothetical protein